MKIVGTTVCTTMPRADWNQTDPNHADYIRNKPTSVGGSDLPSVSSDDEGAFLRVTNGAWAKVKLTDVSVEGA